MDETNRHFMGMNGWIVKYSENCHIVCWSKNYVGLIRWQHDQLQDVYMKMLPKCSYRFIWSFQPISNLRQSFWIQNRNFSRPNSVHTLHMQHDRDKQTIEWNLNMYILGAHL